LRNDLPHAIFAGEKEDLEEIVGNLLENAGKWASRRVSITVRSASDAQRQFEIAIEDDGPGLEADKIEAALKRGSRVDETKPGTGLGLAIVQDTVREYGGQLHLDKSPMGGLRVRTVLPLAED
jgi:signal transduction histidine kinase